MTSHLYSIFKWPSVAYDTNSNIQASIVLEDLGMEYQKYESANSFNVCSIGRKKVLLTRKPGWREETVNPFVENHLICPYADFGSLHDDGGQLQLRQL